MFVRVVFCGVWCGGVCVCVVVCYGVGMVKTILHLCADTGSDSWPYALDSGYDVIRVGSDIGVENYSPDRPIHGVFANPVCTEFSNLRRRPSWAVGDWRESDPALGMDMVRECQRIISEANPVWHVIENPAMGSLRNFLGAPTATYQPWHYGSAWTKATALWGDFVMPDRTHDYWSDVEQLPGLWTRPGREKPSLAYLHKSAFDLIPEFSDSGLPVPTSDAELRSLCSQRFARAFKRVNP